MGKRKLRFHLVGEGKSEVGEPRNTRDRREGADVKGVLDAFVETYVTRDGVVSERKLWKTVKGHLTVGKRKEERLTILRAAEQAKSNQAVAIILRDRDDELNRQERFDNAINEAEAKYSGYFAAGMPVVTLESWFLALSGIRDSERIRDPKKRAADLDRRLEGGAASPKYNAFLHLLAGAGDEVQGSPSLTAFIKVLQRLRQTAG
jgi:hypothetical protein